MGAHCHPEALIAARQIRRRAAGEHRTLSQEITRILTEAIHGRTLPPGSIDRRTPSSPARRRKDDLGYSRDEGKRGGDR